MGGGVCVGGGVFEESVGVGEGRRQPVPRGGTVTFGVLGEARTLDPYDPDASELTYALARPVWPSLYRLGPDGTPEPYLARSLVPTDKGARLTLEAARWSNGRPIRSQDVVASAARANPPSGFAGLGVRRVDRSTVEFRGRATDWERRLARLTFVLPKGRPPSSAISGGPFILESYEPGFQAVYARNTNFWRPTSNVDYLKVRFVDSLGLLLGLLEQKKLDAAGLPSSINLDERLEQSDLQFDDALGWESLRIEFSTALPRAERVGLARLIDRSEIEAFFIREDGRLTNTTRPGPGAAGADGPWSRSWGPSSVPSSVGLAAPFGDELAQMLQRAIFERLDGAGLDVDTLLVASSGLDPLPDGGAVIVRASGAPGLRDGRSALRAFEALPLAQVETIVAWNEGLEGVRANPTFEGPLWNAEDWFVTSP